MTRQTDESGAAATEVVVITPLLLLLLMLVIQFAIWEHATHVVKAAALQGVQAARLDGGTSNAGRMQAESFLRQAGNATVVSPFVSVTRTATNTSVTVNGYAEEVVPMMRLPVKATATGVLEVQR